MKTIIVPTDFSPEASNALKYAIEYALTLGEGSRIHLLHIAPESKFKKPAPARLETQYENDSMRKLKAEINWHTQSAGIRCEAHVGRGQISSEIARVARSLTADLIIMGTKGASGIKAMLMGSNTSNLLEKAECPVLVVPAGAPFRPLKQLIFACNFEEDDRTDIERTIAFSKVSSSKLTLLHLAKEPDFEFNKRMLNWMKEDALTEMSLRSIDSTTLKTDDFTESLEAYLKDQKADVLVMMPKKRGLLSKLFHTSRTREMALHTKTPLLALPEMVN